MRMVPILSNSTLLLFNQWASNNKNNYLWIVFVHCCVCQFKQILLTEYYCETSLQSSQTLQMGGDQMSWITLITNILITKVPANSPINNYLE